MKLTQVLNIANFKGGVGKTTTSVILSLLLSQKQQKVLFIDFDPQANATDLLFYKTFAKEEIHTSIYEALKAKDLSSTIHKLSDTLDIIPAEGDLRNFSRLLNEMFNKDYKMYGYLLDALLQPIKDSYDFIFIDVPPTISDFTDNAIVASDQIALVIQTQEFSLGAAENFIPYIEEALKTYDTDINFLATIPVLLKRKGSTDRFILKEAKKIFGDKLTKNKIQIRERIKAWGLTGIKNEDHHDKAVIKMFNKLADELIGKLKEQESVEQ